MEDSKVQSTSSAIAISRY